MNIASAATTQVEPEAIKDLYVQLIKDMKAEPDLLFICYTIGYDISGIIGVVLSCTPNVSIHGSTSCAGVMTQMGIANVLGDDVPIAGGSSADHELNGSWKQFDSRSVYTNGVVVTTMFPSSEAMFYFHSGYEPTEAKGIIAGAGRVATTAIETHLSSSKTVAGALEGCMLTVHNRLEEVVDSI